MFLYLSVSHSVHREGGYPSTPCRWDPSMPCMGDGIPASLAGGIPACLAWGSPGPHPGGVSQHALRQNPPPRQLLPQAVRILLECILFVSKFCKGGGDLRMAFCQYLGAVWVVSTLIGGVDTQTLITVIKFVLTFCTSRQWGPRTLHPLTPQQAPVETFTS